MSLTNYWTRIKSRENEIWLILVAALGGSLVFGFWSFLSTNFQPEPLTIENVPVAGEGQTKITSGEKPATVTGKYVASKNGTRYYLPTCSGAKRIKEENKIWFKTAAEAQARGLTPAVNCPGL